MSDVFRTIDDDKFVFNKVEYTLITPTDIEELADAINTLNILRSAYVVTIGEDQEICTDLGKKQREYIDTYVRTVGDYTNQYFITNLQYMMKKYGISMKNLEEMLQISAGYISRTAGEDAKRKLSIDIVWKITKLFEVDLNSFISTDLQAPSEDNDLVIRFLNKLKSQTIAKEISWHDEGGNSERISLSMRNTRKFHDENGSTLYTNNHLNIRSKYVLLNNIVSCDDIDTFKKFCIIHYKDIATSKAAFDFLFIILDKESKEIKTETVLSTYGLKIAEIEESAESLYKEVVKQGISIDISASARELMNKYLNL